MAFAEDRGQIKSGKNMEECFLFLCDLSPLAAPPFIVKARGLNAPPPFGYFGARGGL